MEVLLVNFRESPDLVRRVVKERGYTAPVLLDRSGDVTRRVYGVLGPPTMYFVDRQGLLVGWVAGGRDWTRPEAREFIQALVETPRTR